MVGVWPSIEKTIPTDHKDMMMGKTDHSVNQHLIIVSGVKVVATLYDSNNKIVGTGWSYLTIANNLYPNNKSPFEIIIYDIHTSNMQAIASSALAADWY